MSDRFSSGDIELLVFGVLLSLITLFVVIGLIRELTPQARMQWMLSVALGGGVMAFGLKLLFVVLFSFYSMPMLQWLPVTQQSVHTERPGLEKVERLARDDAEQVSNWQSLPYRVPTPADNPQTPEKIRLGEILFHDNNLSSDRTVSCASCHGLNLRLGGGDGQRNAIGVDGQRGARNAPTVYNAAFQQVLFWDGRAASLEEQALGPLLNPIEMGMPDLESVVRRVSEQRRYPPLFRKAFPESDEIGAADIAKAIAAFERTLITPDSAYDRFVSGDKTALTPQQQRGMALFESSGCQHCHSGPNFSAASVFSQTSAYRTFPSIRHPEYEKKYQLVADKGLNQKAEKHARGLWRVPSLRNVSLTAPYFHNGSVETLEEAVRIMATVQLDKVLSDQGEDDSQVYWRSDQRQFYINRNRAISDDEVDAIVAFLKALEGRLPEGSFLATH